MNKRRFLERKLKRKSAEKVLVQSKTSESIQNQSKSTISNPTGSALASTSSTEKLLRKASNLDNSEASKTQKLRKTELFLIF